MNELIRRAIFILILVTFAPRHAAAVENAPGKIICDEILVTHERWVPFPRQDYHFIYPTGFEVTLRLSLYDPSDGALKGVGTYLQIFRAKKKFDPKNPEPLSIIRLRKMTVSKNKKRIILTTEDRIHKARVTFWLKTPFDGITMKVSQMSYSDAREKFELPIRYLLPELKAFKATYSGAEAEEILKLLPYENMEPPIEWPDILPGYENAPTSYFYRSGQVNLAPDGNNTFSFSGFTTQDMVHLLRGLKELGLNPRHPIFKFLPAGDLAYKSRYREIH